MLEIFRSGRLAGDALRRYRSLTVLGASTIILVDLLDVALPIVLKEIIDAIEAGDQGLLPRICLLYIGISFVQAICRILWRVGFFQLGTRMARDTRERILVRLLQLPLTFFSRRRTGDLVSLAQSDTEAVRHVLESGMITIFDGVLYLVVIPIVMFYLSPKLALISLLPIPLIPLIVRRNEKRLKQAAREQQEAVAALADRAHESFSTVRLIKSFAKEDNFLARFSRSSEDVANRSVELARREALFAPQMEGVISFSTAVVLLIGGSLVVDGQLTIGAFIAFQRYLQQLLCATQAVGIWFSHVQRATASSERIERVLNEPDDRSVKGGASTSANELPLTVKELRFGYPEDRIPELLKGVTFSLRRGERVAIVGPSGSGKSTLLKLLLRALPVEKGSIALYGTDYSQLTIEEIREHVAYVEQAPFLFSDTIRANIAPAASTERALLAARRAAVSDEITAMPLGIDTIIGERGITLSGGQRQRVAIARSLAREGTVLLWDNALSSVDLVTESQILEHLNALPERSAALLVTHRLSTTLLMDRILVLRNGVIEQDGTHAELIQDRGGWYHAFCEHQKTLSAIEELEREAGDER